MTKYRQGTDRGAEVPDDPGLARCAARARPAVRMSIHAVVLLSAVTFACGGLQQGVVVDEVENVDEPEKLEGREAPGAMGDTNGSAPSPTSSDGGVLDSSTESEDASPRGGHISNLGDFSIDVADVMVRHESPYPVTRALTVFASRLEIELVDYAGRCADEATGTRRGNTKYVRLVLEHRDRSYSGAVLSPGTYKFGDGPDEAIIERGAVAPSTCESTRIDLPLDPTSTLAKNELVIHTLTDTHVAGTYEIATADGAYLSGFFDAEVCREPFSTTTACE